MQKLINSDSLSQKDISKFSMALRHRADSGRIGDYCDPFRDYYNYLRGAADRAAKINPAILIPLKDECYSAIGYTIEAPRMNAHVLLRAGGGLLSDIAALEDKDTSAYVVIWGGAMRSFDSGILHFALPMKSPRHEIHAIVKKWENFIKPLQKKCGVKGGFDRHLFMDALAEHMKPLDWDSFVTKFIAPHSRADALCERREIPSAPAPAAGAPVQSFHNTRK